MLLSTVDSYPTEIQHSAHSFRLYLARILFDIHIFHVEFVRRFYYLFGFASRTRTCYLIRTIEPPHTKCSQPFLLWRRHRRQRQRPRQTDKLKNATGIRMVLAQRQRQLKQVETSTSTQMCIFIPFVLLSIYWLIFVEYISFFFFILLFRAHITWLTKTTPQQSVRFGWNTFYSSNLLFCTAHFMFSFSHSNSPYYNVLPILCQYHHTYIYIILKCVSFLEFFFAERENMKHQNPRNVKEKDDKQMIDISFQFFLA